jgi:hypothetical protein
MPRTDTETTAVWGIPILFEVKLRAYRFRDFCSGRHMIETCPKLLSRSKSFSVLYKKLKIMRKCRVFKGLSIDTTHDPPL